MNLNVIINSDIFKFAHYRGVHHPQKKHILKLVSHSAFPSLSSYKSSPNKNEMVSSNAGYREYPEPKIQYINFANIQN